jgi:putative transposase
MDVGPGALSTAWVAGQSFFLLLASATDRELIRNVEFLKIENRILRERLPRHIRLTTRERSRLIRAGRGIGSAVNHLISIVTPRTFLRWLNGPVKKEPSRKPGRPRTSESIRELIERMARETGWGYTRILGELRKLGIRSVSRSTVRNILREGGFDPGPKRGEGSWTEFLQRHAATLWACDFFSTKVWTLRGRVDVFVLFFIHIASRRVHIAGMTAHPDRAWMKQQARNVAMTWHGETALPRLLLRDHDTKFVSEFDAILESEGIEIKKLGPMAPNLNASAERWVQTVRQECLDHFVICGQVHLMHLLKSFLAHYHTERPHQGLDNSVPIGAALAHPVNRRNGAVMCQHRLGGLLKHYVRTAA